MNCLNCNRETIGSDVFCDECRQVMEAYPVEKGTPVVIPAQPSPVAPKKHLLSRFASAEDQLAVAQRAVKRLSVVVIVLSLLLILAAVLVYVSAFGLPDFLSA